MLARFSFAAHRQRLTGLLHPLMGKAPGPRPSRLATDPDLRTESTVLAHRARRRLGLARRQYALLRGTAPQIEEPDARFGPALATPLDPAHFETLLVTTRRHGPQWVREGGPVVRELVAAGRLAGWTAHGDLRPAADGGHECPTADPGLTSPPLRLRGSEFRYLLVRMATRTSAVQPMAQLFWLAEDAPGYSEAHSVRWALVPGDEARTYVVDLACAGWMTEQTIVRLRLDPLDAPGWVCIETIALIADLGVYWNGIPNRRAKLR